MISLEVVKNTEITFHHTVSKKKQNRLLLFNFSKFETLCCYEPPTSKYSPNLKFTSIRWNFVQKHLILFSGESQILLLGTPKSFHSVLSSVNLSPSSNVLVPSRVSFLFKISGFQTSEPEKPILSKKERPERFSLNESSASLPFDT